MIIINNFEIQNNGQNLALNVQTETGFIITSVFTVLFAMDKYNVFDKLVIKPKAPNKQNTM